MKLRFAKILCIIKIKKKITGNIIVTEMTEEIARLTREFIPDIKTKLRQRLRIDTYVTQLLTGFND